MAAAAESTPADAVEEAGAEAPAAPAKKSKRGLIIGAAVLVLALAGGGGWFFMSKGKSETAEESGAASDHDSEAKSDGHGGDAKAAKGTAQYVPLTPAFVVNLNDTEAARFLQAEMEVMTRDSKAADEIKNNMPRIRNSVLLLLGSRRVDELDSREEKEKLQADVAAEIQKVLNEQPGKPKIETVYFNSFVMQ